MAEAEKRQYNLCSTKETVQFSVQIQMQNDSNFVVNLLQSNTHDLDSDSAESELNCSAIVDESDSEPRPCKQKHIMQSI